MGFLDSVKERIKGKDSTDVGRGGISYDRSAAKGQPSLDSALKRGAEKRAEKKSFKPYVEKVGRGIDRFNSGVDKVNKVANSFSGGSSKGRRRSANSGDDFGGFGSMFGGSKGSSKGGMGDLGFSSFGRMAGVGGGSRSASKKKKASGGRRGEVPIYQGSRIVGYRRAGAGKRRQKARSIYDIDI